MSELVPEAERLLAVAPEDFVAERKALARTLREEGRGEEAAAVERLRKPSRVVFAVNRAARDRPQAARGAAAAAENVKELQLGGDPEAFQKALRELDDAVGLLADVAVAHVAPPGGEATDAMRHRVRDLLRAAVADDAARPALARGALAEEVESPGFSPFAGMTATAPPKRPARKERAPTAAERRQSERREQQLALRAELDDVERALAGATKAAREAERERARLEREAEALRRRLDRLG